MNRLSVFGNRKKGAQGRNETNLLPGSPVAPEPGPTHADASTTPAPEASYHASTPLSSQAYEQDASVMRSSSVSGENDKPQSESMDTNKVGAKDRNLFHKTKLIVKGQTTAKAIKSDSSLLVANEALEDLKRTIVGIDNIMLKNTGAFRTLAESQRAFGATVSSVYKDTDPVLGLLGEVNAASDSVSEIAISESEVEVLIREAEDMMSSLKNHLEKLVNLHKFREEQTKEYMYFTQKFSQLEENAFKKDSSGAANSKGKEKLARNETKLREVTSVLNSVTDQFYTELASLFEARASFVDKFVRCFVLLQAEKLVAFRNVPNSLSLSEIGKRTTMATVEPPKKPLPAVVHVSYVPSEHPQLKPYGHRDDGVQYPGQISSPTNDQLHHVRSDPSGMSRNSLQATSSVPLTPPARVDALHTSTPAPPSDEAVPSLYSSAIVPPSNYDNIQDKIGFDKAVPSAPVSETSIWGFGPNETVLARVPTAPTPPVQPESAAMTRGSWTRGQHEGQSFHVLTPPPPASESYLTPPPASDSHLSPHLAAGDYLPPPPPPMKSHQTVSLPSSSLESSISMHPLPSALQSHIPVPPPPPDFGRRS